ncbi:MAG: hypothetical protein MJ248_01895 [Bacilli bacterium]|nr:hypothetical protein [Bacilli bacterium]
MRKLLSKDIKSKTLLVSLENLDSIIKEHIDDGWELKNKVEVNGRYKITFTKVK